MTEGNFNKTDGFLNHPNHYDFQQPKKADYKRQSISTDKFFDWTKQNMYRTSYINHYTTNPVEQKNVAIPKYMGYVPYVGPQNIHAKGYSPITRQAFSQQKLGKNLFGLSSTGYNLNSSAFVDPSQNASTSKYGKTALQMPHPAWQIDKLVSTTHDTFRHPGSRLNPTFKETQVHLQTQKQQTKYSGFGQNHSYLDGKGWIPHPILNGDRDRTEYRDRFNARKDFHRDTVLQKSRTLPKPESNYKYNK